MTDRASEREKLLNLAERCEQATGPDRRIDFQIRRALGGARHGEIEMWHMHSDLVRWKDGSTSEEADTLRYTASLDAAMTLVPEGAVFALSSFDPDTHETDHCCAGVGDPDHAEVEIVRAATPALTLCAAVLRNREKEQG